MKRTFFLFTLFAVMLLRAVARDIAHDMVVAQDGTGDYRTIQEAINAVPDMRKMYRTVILVKEGVYKEKVIVAESKQAVALIGEGNVVISYDDYAQKMTIFGEEKGTSGSASIYIYSTDFYAENITFENSAGPVGQAVACFVSADRVAFRHCRFLGYQDTLYTYGILSRQYYEDCYIEGTVDFIFGWSTAVFNRCEIHSLANGYLTAPATPKDSKYGYVFYDCRLTAAPEAKQVYLSRPWRPYAKAVYIRCFMDSHILPEGWHNWGKEENEHTAYFAEWMSTGPGANSGRRTSWSHQLESPEGYAMEDVLGGTDGWSPMKPFNRVLPVIKR